MDTNSVDTAQIVAAAVGRSEIANSTTTAAGSLPAASAVQISLNDWALFPMIHQGATTSYNLQGNSTDGGSASAPRFAFRDSGSDVGTYDVDHRWIIAA